MPRDSLKYIISIYKERTGVLCVLVSFIVLLIDYITGKHIEFPIAYALPVGMAAFRNKKTEAYVMAILLPLVRIGFHFLWQQTQSLPEDILNATITGLALMFYAYAIDRIAWQKRELEKEVKILEGFLSICASCKRIKNEKGEYEEIEKYVSERSKATFSHGICPECARKLYPEVFSDRKV
ncbi:MAG: hypothetical protein VR65_23705 [Desulfobulbaceae bacterium BRH_c16a]|nr:MAG: hypothetical protein VR65_23705 [Desulfobulbaceae bacterium BRH_c16a]